jgi:hypothetical protein
MEEEITTEYTEIHGVFFGFYPFPSVKLRGKFFFSDISLTIVRG